MGARQVVLRKVDGAEILRRVEQHGVTLLCGRRRWWPAILDAAAARDERGARRATACAWWWRRAAAHPHDRAVETELGWEFIQIYGLTETSPLLTINRRRPSGTGSRRPSGRARLARAGVPALGRAAGASSEDGEVLARSNVVFEGYWNQPETPPKAIEDGWFHTGDGGYRRRRGGYLAISDRKKDVIITGGENVSSIEVEDASSSTRRWPRWR